MELFITAVRRLSVLGGVVSVLLLIAAVVVVCHLVLVRYLLGGSAIWQHEFVTYSLIAATFIGSPYVLLTHGHVNVDLLPLYLGRRTRFALALLATAIALLFCLLLTITGYRFWEEAWRENWTGDTVWAPPLWIPYLSLPLGMGLLSLQYLADLLALVTGRAAPFGLAEGRP